MASGGYVPMPFAPGWLLERHLGWSLLEQRSDLKLLGRRLGPFRQFLLMSRGTPGTDELSTLLQRAGFVGWRSSIVWNDFEDAGQDAARVLAGCALVRAQERRWFGVGTFVIDLSLDEPALLGRMASRERGAVRRAQALGFAGEIVAQPSEAELEQFLALYRPVALGRGLELPELATLRRISTAGDLCLARLRDQAGRALIVNLVYRRGDLAWFLYGARDLAAPGWAGPATQWATLCELKRTGARWYDLGLVASRDERDGIYRFKSGLGGAYLSHGNEYRHEPSLLRVARRLRVLGARSAWARPQARVTP